MTTNLTQLQQTLEAYWPLFVIMAIWSLAWKGAALWKAARRSEPKWFIALLILNTVGILEIIYIFFVAGLKEREE